MKQAQDPYYLLTGTQFQSGECPCKQFEYDYNLVAQQKAQTQFGALGSQFVLNNESQVGGKRRNKKQRGGQNNVTQNNISNNGVVKNEENEEIVVNNPNNNIINKNTINKNTIKNTINKKNNKQKNIQNAMNAAKRAENAAKNAKEASNNAMRAVKRLSGNKNSTENIEANSNKGPVAKAMETVSGLFGIGENKNNKMTNNNKTNNENNENKENSKQEGGKKRQTKNKKRNQRGAGCYSTKSLIPDQISSPSDLKNNGSFSMTQKNWKDMLTGFGVQSKNAISNEELMKNNYGIDYETQAGGKNKNNKKNNLRKNMKGGQSIPENNMNQQTNNYASVVKKTNNNAGLASVPGGAKKKVQKGGIGSDWIGSQMSRGPVNAPNMSLAEFRASTKTGEYIPNNMLQYAAAPISTGVVHDNFGISGYDPAIFKVGGVKKSKSKTTKSKSKTTKSKTTKSKSKTKKTTKK
jgi:hypothetical protein